MALTVMIDGKSVKLTKDEEILAYVQKLEAERASALAAASATTLTGFRVSLAKYSMTNPKTPVSKRGKAKGTIAINSMGSRYAITLSFDQWADLKAHQAEIDKFIEENKSQLRPMAELLKAGNDE
jgi:hypothetical protein